jgi:hypothetical protein
MQSTFDRVKEGKIFDNNLKPYSQEFLEKILHYMEERERYEDCLILQNIINKRLNHDNNYKNLTINKLHNFKLSIKIILLLNSLYYRSRRN